MYNPQITCWKEGSVARGGYYNVSTLKVFVPGHAVAKLPG